MDGSGRLDETIVEAARPAAPVSRPRRPLAFLLHSLVGLKVSVFLAFVCLTGTIATVSHEIEWLFMPEIRATNNGATDDWGAMWDAVRRAYPDAYIESLGTYDRADSRYFAREAILSFPDGRQLTVFVDPQTATVTGAFEGQQFHAIMRALHYYLFIPTDWPFYLVSSLGFVLLFSMVTGLLVYKKFWRGFLRVPRWNKGVRLVMGDLHRLVALWSLWFVTLMAVTSIWYFFERLVPVKEAEPPAVTERLIMHRPDGAEINRWVATARTEMPGLNITMVALPYSADGPATIQGQWRAILVRERTNAVYIDPQTGAAAGKRNAHELGALQRWIHTADPLHFGNFGGLLTKLIWVVFGLALTALSITGAVIYVRRTAQVVTGTAAK